MRASSPTCSEWSELALLRLDYREAGGGLVEARGFVRALEARQFAGG